MEHHSHSHEDYYQASKSLQQLIIDALLGRAICEGCGESMNQTPDNLCDRCIYVLAKGKALKLNEQLIDKESK